MSKKNKKGRACPLSEVKGIMHKWLSLEDDNVVDVMLGIILANMLNTDPNWLLIVGPPSNAKTEVLRALDGHPQAYFLSNLTPSTLVSGLKPKGKLPEPSLLPKLDGKTLVLKDFTTILAMRSDAQSEIIAQLREIYDGSYTKAFGNGKVIDWHGHVGLLGATTPVYDKHYSVIGSLGDRFLLYRLPDSNGRTIGKKAQKLVGQETQMRDEIQSVVHKFLNQFEDGLSDLQIKTDPVLDNMLVELACFVSLGRCPVDRDYRTRDVTYVPQPEGTPRVLKQLMQLGMGLAVAQDKTEFDFEIYELLKKVGRDLLPAARLKILAWMYEKKVFEYLKERRTTREIAEAVNLPGSTTKMLLEDMSLVQMLKRNMDSGAEKAAYEWQIADEMVDIISKSEVFKVSENDAL